MASPLARSQPLVHHSLSLDQPHPRALQQVHEVEVDAAVGFDTRPRTRVLWGTSTQSDPSFIHSTETRTMTTSTLPLQPELAPEFRPVRPAARPRLSLSLSHMITSSRLLRRLSTSPTSPTSTRHPVQSIPQPLNGENVPADLDDAPRRGFVRSATLPTLPSVEPGWELLERDEGLAEESAAPGIFHAPHRPSQPSPPHASVLPRGIPSASIATIHKPASVTPFSGRPLPIASHSAPTSAPSSPCQRVWLCTPPKPLPSPTFAKPRCQRRPAITTRAHSNARMAKEFDENGTLVYISSHSDRVLEDKAVVKDVSRRKEQVPRRNISMGARLSRSRSEVLPDASAFKHRPNHHRAETTGHASSIRPSQSASALEDEAGRARESGSREPLLEAEDDEGEPSVAGVRKLMMGM